MCPPPNACVSQTPLAGDPLCNVYVELVICPVQISLVGRGGDAAEAPAHAVSICQAVGALPSLAWLMEVLGLFLTSAWILDEVGQCPLATLVLRWCRTWRGWLLKAEGMETAFTMAAPASKGGSIEAFRAFLLFLWGLSSLNVPRSSAYCSWALPEDDPTKWKN